MKRYPQFSIRHPKAVLAIWGAILMAMGFLIVLKPQIRLNPTFKSMIMTNDRDRAFDKHAKEAFGDDEIIVVAFENPKGVIQVDSLAMLDRLTRAIKAVPGVRDVYSLTDTDDIRGRDGMLLTDDLITDLPKTPEDLARISHDLEENPTYTGTIVSADRKVASINVELAPSHSDPKEQAKVTEAVLKLAHEEEVRSHVPIHVTGLPVSSYFGGNYMIHDMVLFGALSCVLLFAVIWIAFRKGQAMVFTMITAMCGVAVTYGIMSLFGVAVTMPLSAVMVFVMAIGMEYAIHTGHTYNFQTLEERAEGHKIRDVKYVLSEGIRGSRGALIFSGVATIVGFASMLTNPVPDLAKMGLFLCIGCAALIFAALTLVPAIITLWPYEVTPAQETPRLNRVIEVATESAIKRPMVHVGVMLVIIAVSVWGWSKLSSDTDAMQYFKKSSKVRQDEEFVRARMNGTTYLQAVVVGPALDTFKEPENLRKLDAIQAYAETLPHVTRAVSHADHIKLINRALHDGVQTEYRIPDTKAAVEQELLLHHEPDDFRLVIDSDYREASMMVRLDTMSSTVLKSTEAKIEAKIAETFGPQFKGNVVGTTLLVHRAFDEMADAMAQGLALACVMAMILMFLFLRSWKLAFLSLLPNIIPIAMNYAVLGFIGHPIDPPAAVTGAIALGLSVDDTSHMFWTWLRAIKQKGASPSEAVRAAMKEVGPPTVIKTCVVAFGFSIMMFSQYGTLVWMGIMLAVVTVNGVLWDMLVTPALLRLTKITVSKPSQKQMEEMTRDRINKAQPDPDRTTFAQYSDDELAKLAVYDFLALAGFTVIRQGGSYGTRRLLYELDLKPGEKVLEFGSGVGGNAFELHETYKVQTYGTDLSAFMVEKANRRAQERGLGEHCKFVQNTADRLPFEDNTFDAIIVEAVVMYTDAQKTLAELFRVLKPGGKLGFHDWSWTVAPDEAMEKLTNVIACGCNVEEVKFFSKADWEKVLQRRGFDLKYSQEFPFDFFSWHGMTDAEGTWGTFKIFGRIFARRAAVKRMIKLMKFLTKYEGNIGYVIMTAKKPLDGVAPPLEEPACEMPAAQPASAT